MMPLFLYDAALEKKVMGPLLPVILLSFQTVSPDVIIPFFPNQSSRHGPETGFFYFKTFNALLVCLTYTQSWCDTAFIQVYNVCTLIITFHVLGTSPSFPASFLPLRSTGRWVDDCWESVLLPPWVSSGLTPQSGLVLRTFNRWVITAARLFFFFFFF